IGSEQAVVPLIQLLTTTKNADVCWSAADALGELDSFDIIKPLKKALKNENKIIFGYYVKNFALNAIDTFYRKHQAEGIKEHFILDETNPPW
ncbi:MAG: HEAT repeat domain-containing protein, partial [bacterium]